MTGGRFGVVAAAAWATLAAAEAEPGIRFRRAGPEWGIEARHRHGGTGELYLIETMGAGCAVLDYDGDGDADLLFVDSGELEPGGSDPRLALFRNDGGRFVDATAASGVRLAAYGMGVAAADVDGDADLDLYLTAVGANQLLVNSGDGTFVDRTAAAGVGDTAWGAGAAFADVDLDGDLDLYLANYLDFSFDNNPICGDKERGIRAYCHPEVYPGVADRFWRNRGDGTFEDATVEAGFAGARGKGLGTLFSDLDGDGWPDLYVANDTTPNFLFTNRGDGTFEESALLAGAAVGQRGESEAGMGVDAGDLDGDGRFEIVVTNFFEETNALYSASGPSIYVDRRFPAGLAEPSLLMVGFGVALADLDRDSHLDVVVANGHIVHNAEAFGGGGVYRQPNQIFRNLGGGTFELVEESGLVEIRSSRGLAVGDLDGDHDLDLVVTSSNEPADVYENLSDPAGGWVEVELAAASGNRLGIGARVEVVAGGRRQLRERRAGSSYLSQSSLRLHFGLGEAGNVDALEVRWPLGERRRYLGLPADRRFQLYDPSGAPTDGNG